MSWQTATAVHISCRAGARRRVLQMKRPKIEKDSITELLRANLAVPQLSIELDQPSHDHTWHSCYDTVYDSKCDDVTVAGTEVMPPGVPAADFLRWLRAVRMVDVVYCSGHYLQAMRRDFLSPGMGK